jgi:polyisoprenoid-binding protein YceI
MLALGAIAAVFLAGAAVGLGGRSPNGADSTMLEGNAAQMQPAIVGDWIVDPAASRIAFEGRHGEKTFHGQFGRWSARISFDPAKLENASASISIATSSAKTGDSYYDLTLPSEDWLDVASHPAATFVSTAFRQTGAGTYEVNGNLTIRGVSRPVTFPFELKSNGRDAKMTTALSINRLDFGIGEAADPKAEWVSNPIGISLVVTAKRKTQ